MAWSNGSAWTETPVIRRETNLDGNFNNIRRNDLDAFARRLPLTLMTEHMDEKESAHGGIRTPDLQLRRLLPYPD
jgi:hypothetical protein